MNDPQSFQIQFLGFEEVFFNDAFDIPRWNCVEVEDVVNRYLEGFLQKNRLYVLRLITANNFLHLILQMKFDFLQTMFLDFILGSGVRVVLQLRHFLG